MRLLLTSDWHIQRGAWKSRPQICGDSRAALKHVIDLAISDELSVDAIVAAGDLYDVVYPHSSDVQFVAEQLDRLERHSITLLYVQGQHERSFPPWLSAHRWPIYFNEELIHLGDGVRLYGLDWHPQDSLADKLAKIPPSTTMFVCHQVWAELLPFGPEGSLESVPHADYIVTGDRHLHTSFPLKTREAMVFSPGSFAMQDISEEPQKAVFLFDTATGKAQSLPLPSRPVCRAVFDDPAADPKQCYADLAQALDQLEAESRSLPEEIRKPILRVHLTPDTAEAFNQIRPLLKARCHIFPELKLSEEEGQTGRLDASTALAGGRALARKRLDDVIRRYTEDEKLIDSVIRLVGNADVSVEEELRRIEEEVKAQEIRQEE